MRPATRNACGLLLLLLAAALLLLAPPTGTAAVTCNGKKATIVGTPGDDVIVGKRASDVIWGGGGNDRIIGGPNGNDTICGGPGNDVLIGGRGYDVLIGGEGDDRLIGGTGSDVLDGGGGEDILLGGRGSDILRGGEGDDVLTGHRGSDKLRGGGGHDVLEGEQGSDRLEGEAGDDLLLGDKGNDRLLGGEGNDRVEGGAGDDPLLDGGPGTDVVIGGTGIDHATGGPGDGDVVRGDNGTDKLDGGPGERDIVSYASASRGGVFVNLAANKARGDGHDELSGFEDVVGSPQDDQILGNGAANRIDGGVGDDELVGGGGGGVAYGGPGSDECRDFGAINSCGPEPAPPPGHASVTLNLGLDGASLVVKGSNGPDEIRIAHAPGTWTVVDSVPIHPGEGCSNPPGDRNTAVCPDPGVPLVVVTAGGGDDRVAVDASVPAEAKVRVNGNAGGDTLIGGPHADVLEAGENYNGPDHGNDRLEGNGGGDVLYADPGADVLLGGPGNDLLVSSVVTCQGHRFEGGPGVDTVSYARSRDRLRIALGGTGAPPGCGRPDAIGADNESLEGSDGPDVLIGDNGDNSLMGHDGADVFIARGGNDFIEAIDGQRDRSISCGPGRDEVMRDGKDPRGSSC